MIQTMKNQIGAVIANHFELDTVIVEDAKIAGYDLSVPLFNISRQLKKNPKLIFDEISEILNLVYIKEFAFVNGFLNINLDREKLATAVLNQVLKEQENYGSSKYNAEEIIVIDYSSPNIAKSFGVGHLRSTVIGNAIKKLFEKTGAKVFGINHLGDWGTQFGKMIVAYQKWGNEADIIANPVTELQKLYVKFHQLESKDESLAQEGRDAFKKLEEGDPEITKLWQWFKDESLKEFEVIYQKLGVSFDSNHGEAFYNDKMAIILQMLDEKGLTKVDDGATIVSLDELDLPPALIKRSDGASLYMTRDLAAVNYRRNKYHYTKAIYVVGNEQKLHFKQLSAVSEKLGFNEEIIHIGFGLVMINGKKMSTREGNFVSLDLVIEEAISQALEQIVEKNPNLDNKLDVARAVGVGAIIFNDLKNERNLNVDFNLENMLKFEGQTGPYLQYSSVRINSILKNQKATNTFDSKYFNDEHYYQVIKRVAEFPEIVIKATNTYNPSILAKYLLLLSQDFNSFYGAHKILVELDSHLQTNLSLIKAIQTVLNEGMRLLGITALEEM